MRSPRTARAASTALLVALTVGALAACSDDGGDAGPTTTGGQPASDATTTTSPGQTTTTDEAAIDLVLRGDGLGIIDLGAAPADAVASVVEALGEPTRDTGWQSSASEYGTCPGDEVRGVEWDHLVLLFTNGDTDYGRGEHLFSWHLTGAPPAVGTASGFGYQATAADAEELYPGKVEEVPAEEPFPGFLRIDAEGGAILAFLDDEDIVTNLQAGAPCGE